jgi:alcohol dehydrogenase class IV
MTAASFEFATAGRIMAGAGRGAELPGVPGLAAFGLTAGQAAAIAAQALTSSSMQGNPVPLSQDEPEAIIGRAL